MELFLPTDKSARNKKSSTQQTTLIKFPTGRSQKPLTEVKFRLNANTDLCGTTSKPTTRYSGWSGPLFTKQHQKPRNYHTHTHTHTRLMALFPGLPRSAGTRKVKPIWILLKQETVSDSGISWAICTSAPCSKQITTPAPHHSVFYRPDALPAAQPTASKHWRPNLATTSQC